MNRLDELIQELCPDGIESVKIGQIAREETQRNKGQICNLAYSITKNGLVKTSEYFKDAKVTSEDTSAYKIVKKNWFVYSPSRIDVGSINYLRDQDQVIVSPMNVVFSVDETLVLPSYLLLYLQSRRGSWAILQKREGIEGMGRKLLPFDSFAKIPVPLPPLTIQQEIVRTLAIFTEHLGELSAELSARKLQYEYYRNELLSFDNTVEWLPIETICKKIVSGGTPQSGNPDYYGGPIPWLRTQEVDWRDIYDTAEKITEAGFYNSSTKWIPANCVIVAMYGATAAKVAINRIPLTTNQACCNLIVDENKALYRYVFHYLSKEYYSLKALGQGSQNNINAQIIKQYKIPVPPIEVQKRIVDTLDSFDEICSDLNNGLPAEIESRQKQYEFYRDKLLSFSNMKGDE